jgi:hypothetical protein
MCFKSTMVSKPPVYLALKTQSPLTLRWRLLVEVSHTCRFETTVKPHAPLGLMDSRRYRPCYLSRRRLGEGGSEAALHGSAF